MPIRHNNDTIISKYCDATLDCTANYGEVADKKSKERKLQQLSICLREHENTVSTGCLKKMSFSGKTAITTFKLIQNAKVLENSGYLLQHGH